MNDIRAFKIKVKIEERQAEVFAAPPFPEEMEESSLPSGRDSINLAIEEEEPCPVNELGPMLTVLSTVEYPDLQGIRSGVQSVLTYCRDVLLSFPSLMQHFTDGQR